TNCSIMADILLSFRARRSCFGCLRGARTVAPTQRRIETSIAQKSTDVVDSQIPSALKIVVGQADSPISIVELTHASADIPLRLEPWNGSVDLAAVHSVATLVRSRAGCVLNLAIWHDVHDHFRQFTDSVILMV